MIVVQGDAQLMQIVAALGAAAGLTGRLHRGQQERGQNADDGNYDQELDQREPTALKAATDRTRLVSHPLPRAFQGRDSGARPRSETLQTLRVYAATHWRTIGRR